MKMLDLFLGNIRIELNHFVPFFDFLERIGFLVFLFNNFIVARFPGGFSDIFAHPLLPVTYKS
jgi:hypothetical protein